MATTHTGAPPDVTGWTVAPRNKETYADIRPEVHYRQATDTLFMTLWGLNRPSVGFVVHDYFVARIDPETNQLVGIEIPHFASEAVIEYPVLLPLLDLAGVSAGLADKTRKRARTDAAEQRRETAAEIFDRYARQFIPNSGAMNPSHP